MKEELYKKVYIKTEEDLPKESGYYFVKRRNASIPDTLYYSLLALYIEKLKPYWVSQVDWYLIPIEQREVTDEEIDTRLEFRYLLYTRKQRKLLIKGFKDCVKWMREPTKD